jgi:hypothetical protein
MNPGKELILKTKKTILLNVIILFIAAGVAQAQVSITYSARGKQHFTMTIPDDWQINVGSETDPYKTPEGEKEPPRIISAMPNSGVPLWFGLWVPEDLEKIEGAMEYMTSLGLDLLADLAITERKHDTLNSMEVNYVSGTGKKDGEVMDFRAGFFQLSPEHVAIAIYIGPHETTISHGEDLSKMIESLKSLIQQTT